MPLRDAKAYVLGNECMWGGLWRIFLGIRDGRMDIEPGQFVHMTVPNTQSHILRRPFSVLDVDDEEPVIEILYQVVGAGTEAMTDLELGDEVSLIGAVGRPWSIPEGAKRILLVGAGVGAAPLFLLYKKAVELGIECEVVLGATTEEALVCRDRYTEVCGCTPHISTDDGTCGHAGFCTEVAADVIDASVSSGARFDQAYVCGPEPVMRIVSAKCKEAQIPCQVSLEKRMACGVGACLSCVVDTVDGKKRACVDGPVFNAEDVIW